MSFNSAENNPGFPFQHNPKNLDPSYKTDLDLCFEKDVYTCLTAKLY